MPKLYSLQSVLHLGHEGTPAEQFYQHLWTNTQNDSLLANATFDCKLNSCGNLKDA